VSGVVVGSCEVCGRQRFPRPIWCASCGSQRIRGEEVESGVIEEVTTVRRRAGQELPAPVRIGSVRTPGDVVVIARLDPPTREGDGVKLSVVDGAPVARRRG
jgi:uncharacterized OB-fold protein